MTLYSMITWLKHFCKDKSWIVENVVPYYEPLVKPTVKLDRHLIWSNFEIPFIELEKPEVKHNQVSGKTERYGISLDGIKMKHRKDQIIRNCVNPEMGLHILNCSSFLKDKNTCNKLEEDACGLASGSKVRETLSSPVSYNLNSTTGNTGGKN